MKFILILLLFVLNTDINTSLIAQSISGKIILPANAVKSVKRGPYGKPAAVKNSGSDSDQIKQSIIVWIESDIEQEIKTETSEIPVLNQKEIQFEPRLIVIRQGEKVKITNNDPVYHNVFSLSSVKKFDIGRRIKGESVDVAFEKPGIVTIFCDIHSHMNAEIIVLSHKTNQWITASTDGSFEFTNLSKSGYTLHAYSPGFKEFTKEIKQSESPLNLTITLEK
jgi:plastocyanin